MLLVSDIKFLAFHIIVFDNICVQDEGIRFQKCSLENFVLEVLARIEQL
jgi:hypothetical protein